MTERGRNVHLSHQRGLLPRINVEVEGDTIKHVDFIGGCNGNLKAISKLVEGKDIAEVCSILDGNTCGNRSTSCADQLCHALREAKSAE